MKAKSKCGAGGNKAVKGLQNMRKNFSNMLSTGKGSSTSAYGTKYSLFHYPALFFYIYRKSSINWLTLGETTNSQEVISKSSSYLVNGNMSIYLKFKWKCFSAFFWSKHRMPTKGMSWIQNILCFYISHIPDKKAFTFIDALLEISYWNL